MIRGSRKAPAGSDDSPSDIRLTAQRTVALESFVVVAVGGALLLAFHALYARYFSAAAGGIGHDYAYFLPALLDSYYWTLNNGPWHVQWFTPAFCGGLPAFPNPQNVAFTLPYWLNQSINPLDSIYLTVLAFAAVGFGGFYVLLRCGFQVSTPASLLGAALFMFNGFYVHRMLIGHFAFHTFMLVPLIAFCLLRPCKAGGWRSATDCSIAGGLLAYAIYAGGATLMPMMLLALALTGLIHSLINGHAARFWAKFGCAATLATALSAVKLVPMLAFVGAFPRDYLPLPGFDSLFRMLAFLGRALFWTPPIQLGADVLVGTPWPVERQELEYGVSLVPLIFLLAGLAYLASSASPIRRLWTSPPATRLNLLLALLLGLAPMALNIAAPAWTGFLKSLPVLGNMSIMLRWFSAYVPVVILLACLAFDRTPWFRDVRAYVAGMAIAILLVINFNVDRSYYAQPFYDPRPVIGAYERVRSLGRAPPIKAITAVVNSRGDVVATTDRNDALVRGQSQMYCYEPIFGYGLDTLRLQPLRPDMVHSIRDGLFNLKNPACYVFGAANRCRPGDHFAERQAAAAQAFARYAPFIFEQPRWQLAAAALTSVSAAIVLLLWAGSAIAWALGRAAPSQG